MVTPLISVPVPVSVSISPPFFVIGGIYHDCDFAQLRLGETQQIHGPFDDWQKAIDFWTDISWRHIDDCFARFFIVDENNQPIKTPK